MGIEVVCADVPSPVEIESKLHLVFTNNLLFITRDYLDTFFRGPIIQNSLLQKVSH